jgi:phosphomannomutase/phosphoglucomutase
VADTELDDETVYRIGSAIGTIAGELGEQTLIVGCDGRASSGRIRAVVEKALLQSGRDVIDIGLVPTPLLYFATRHLEAGSGVMITGSHSPAEVNGMKIVLQRQTAAHDLTGKVMNLANTGRFSKGTGHRIQQDVLADYLDNVAGDIAIAVPLKIVVDAGNGATGPVAPTLLEELGCEVISLHCEVDGSFPHHGPDTGNEENLQDLVREVLASKADFGVAFDGDGDRLAVVTGSGRILPTDTLLMLFAKDVVSRNPGADVVYDVKCSRNLAQLVTSLGGRPVLWKTGHALMKEKMLETGALLGGEFSGHIFFGERWFGFDDGMYAASRLAEILSSEEADLDELIAELPQSLGTPEILVPVPEEEKFALIRRFVADAEFESGKRNDLDGLRVDFEQGWGLLRASNTTAALTARFEADDEAQLAQIKRQFREQLARVAPSLEIPF